MHLRFLRRGRRHCGGRYLCFVLAILLVGMLFLPLWMRSKAGALALPIFESTAKNQVEKIVRESGEELLKEGNYGEFCRMQYSDDGTVQGVTVNSREIQRFATDLSARLERSFENFPLRIEIRSGDLICPKIFSGSGFYLTVKGSLYGGATVEPVSRMAEGGLNQTLHSIRLQVTAPLTLTVLGRQKQLTVTSDLLICETVIVGGLPGGLVLGQ